MILGFHYHIPAVEKQGVIYTSGFLGVFLDSLAKYVTEIVCFMHSPLASEDFLMDYGIESKNIHLVSMGPHVSVPRRLLTSRRILKGVAHELSRLDVLLIRCPTPLLYGFHQVRDLKKCYLIVGDYKKSSQDIRQPFFRKKAIQLWAVINKIQQNRAVKDTLVFVNNGLIYNEMKGAVKQLRLIKTTTLRPEDFNLRQDTCKSSGINLLYTGRLDLSKGLIEMIEALSGLRLKGVDARIHIVGWEDKNESTVTTILKNKARELGLNDYVFFHGKKQVGRELNFFYCMADIYIIGSKVNEGFPRTIWEAFANSVPVIASAVGSIPLFIQHEVHGILIKPGSSEEMIDAVTRLLGNSELRKSLIKNAYELAQSNTLDLQAEAMIAIVKDYANSQ